MMSFDSKLKTVSVEAIQNAVAKALSELVDEDYVCNVSELQFEGAFNASMRVEISPRIDIFHAGRPQVSSSAQEGRTGHGTPN